jgi:hypothetical protein
MNLPAGQHPGQLCLHASAVVVGEGLLAFVAPKNQGKSTLSVALADAGALRVSDDNIVVASSRPVTARSGDQLDKLEESERRASRDLERAGVQRDARGAHGGDSAAPLERWFPLVAVYLLTSVTTPRRERAAERKSVRLVPGVVAMARNVKPSLRQRVGESGRILQTAVTVVSAVPVYQLHVIRSLDRIHEAARQIIGWHR